MSEWDTATANDASVEIKGHRISGSAFEWLKTPEYLAALEREKQAANVSEEVLAKREKEHSEMFEYAMRLASNGISKEQILSMVESVFRNISPNFIHTAVDYALPHTANHAGEKNKEIHSSESEVGAKNSQREPKINSFQKEAEQAAKQQEIEQRQREEEAKRREEEERQRQEAAEKAAFTAKVAIAMVVLNRLQSNKSDPIEAMKEQFPDMSTEELRTLYAEARKEQEKIRQQQVEERRRQESNREFQDSVQRVCKQIIECAGNLIRKVGDMLSPSDRKKATAIGTELIDSGNIQAVQNLSADELRQVRVPDITPELVNKAKNLSLN